MSALDRRSFLKYAGATAAAAGGVALALKHIITSPLPLNQRTSTVLPGELTSTESSAGTSTSIVAKRLSYKALSDLAVVGVHPFNWIEKNPDLFWNRLAGDLHVQFVDRATGFMEGTAWYEPNVDSSTVSLARTDGILTGSYMEFTPIPPSPMPRWKDPNGNLGSVLDVSGGRDLNRNVIYHPDGIHVTLSVSCPDWLQHFADSAKKILDQGLDAIDIDNISIPPFAFGGDFSDWSVYKFRSYLTNRFTKDQLLEIGVEDVDEFDVRNYVHPQLELDQATVDVLVLASPTVSLSPEEIARIVRFVSGGGGLLVQIEPEAYDVLNSLLKEFGIGAMQGAIVSSVYLWDKGSFEVRDLDQQHEITNGIGKLVINWGTAFEVSNLQAVVLARTSSNTWLDINGNMERDVGEPSGPFPVVIALEYGSGRILVVGDRSQDSNFQSYQRLLEKALKWLTRGRTLGKALLFDELHSEEATLSPERASSLNIDHPEWFLYSSFEKLAKDIGFMIAATKTAPRFPEDRVLVEFVRFLHIELLNFVRAYTAEIKKYADQHGKYIPVYGNQWLGTLHDGNMFRDIALDSILVSSFLDLIQVEAVPPTLPPRNRLTLLYRIAHAMGEYRKPVWHQGAFYSPMPQDESRVRDSDVCLTVLGIAEAYANGAIKELDLAGWPGVPPFAGTVILPNMTVPDKVRELIDFVWANRSLLVGFKPCAKIAVVYSVPSFLWNLFPAQDVYPERQQRELVGIADMLQQLRMPYEIVLFGHPEILEDTLYLKRLSEYDVVILPGVTDISPVQVNMLVEHIKNGGKLLLTGGVPPYDHEHVLLTPDTRTQLENLAKAYPDRVNLTRDTLGEHWYGNIINGYVNQNQYTPYLSALKDMLSRVVEREILLVPKAPFLVETNLLKKASTVTVHIINYNYGLESRALERLSNVKLTLDTHAVGYPVDITYCTPGKASERLKYVLENDHVSVTLPSLEYWGFIVISTKE